MKKKIFIGVAAVAVTAIVAINVNSTLQSDNLSVLSLANVEALAGESNGATPCGGDKVEGQCQCINTVNCKDLYGCQ
jgi:hypothetical protein